MGDIFECGQWLHFSRGTCFGSKNDHIGFIVAIDKGSAVAIAVNATSKVVNVTLFADSNGIDPMETIVTIKSNDGIGGCHFSKPTAFDCNRPAVFTQQDMKNWEQNGMVHEVDFNVVVNADLVARVSAAILNSPMVPERYKKIIRNQTQV